MKENNSYFSLSKFAGILIGIIFLLGIYLINLLTADYGQSYSGASTLPIAFLEILIISVGFLLLLTSLLILWIIAKRKAKKSNDILWDKLSKSQRFHTLISLIIFCFITIIIANKGYYSLVTPLLLFFYGLFLINLSRFKSKPLLYLGILEIILAVFAYLISDKEILFLIIGFGILNILYGIFTFNKKATS